METIWKEFEAAYNASNGYWDQFYKTILIIINSSLEKRGVSKRVRLRWFRELEDSFGFGKWGTFKQARFTIEFLIESLYNANGGKEIDMKNDKAKLNALQSEWDELMRFRLERSKYLRELEWSLEAMEARQREINKEKASIRKKYEFDISKLEVGDLINDAYVVVRKDDDISDHFDSIGEIMYKTIYNLIYIIDINDLDWFYSFNGYKFGINYWNRDKLKKFTDASKLIKVVRGSVIFDKSLLLN